MNIIGNQESFFINWANRLPRKALSLKVLECTGYSSITSNIDNINIIYKYIKLGIIKKFYTTHPIKNSSEE